MKKISPLHNLLWQTFLVCGLLALSKNVQAQNPVTKVFEDWNTTSGTQNEFIKAQVRTATLSGTVYSFVVGSTINSSGNYDILIEKLGPSGNLIWASQYDGPGHGNDVGADVGIASNGEVYVAGTEYESSGDSSDAIVIKYSAAGAQRWTNKYNGSGSHNDGFSAVLVVNATSLAVTGSCWSTSNKYDMVTRKLDTAGTTAWTTTYDNVGLNDGAVSLAARSGSLYVTGGTETVANTTYKIAVWKMNPATGAITTTTLSSSASFGISQVTSIVEDASGYVYICGTEYNVSTGFDFVTKKFDSSLSLVWSNSYNSSGTYDDVANSLCIDAHSNVIVTGYSNSATGKDYTTIKYNSSGTQKWIRNYDGGGNDSATAIVVNDSNHIYITGRSYNGATNDYYTIRYDASGNKIWEIGFNGISNSDDRGLGIALDTLGAVVVTGQNKLSGGTYTYTTVKYVEQSITYPKDTIAYTETNYPFTENKGQLLNTSQVAVPQIRYYTMNESPAIFFTDTSVSYVLAKIDTSSLHHDTTSRVDMKFVGANSDLRVRSMDVRKEYSSFFYPTCPDGISRVQDYDKLVSTNVWNNVDIIYGSNHKGLKTYFICQPGGGGGSVNYIDLKYEGADSVKIDGAGQLVIYTKVGTIVQPKAAAWQIDGSGNYSSLGWQPTYHIIATNEVGFTSIGSYNTAQALVIAVDWGYRSASIATNWYQNNVWSTYLKGYSPIDYGLAITSDNAGNTYVTGTTESSDFPQIGNVFQQFCNNWQDAFCIKFDNQNYRTWCTYIGGYAADIGHDIKIKNNSDVVIYGYTTSDDFPTATVTGTYQNQTNVAGDQTYFLFELNSMGQGPAVWSTYFGGTHEEFENFGNHLAIDNSDNIYIVGMTRSNQSQGFPIHTLTSAYNQGTFAGGTQDGFIASFDNTKNLTWCSYFGGSGIDDVTSIALSGSDIFISGNTGSTTTSSTCAANLTGAFPICNGGYYQQTNQGYADGFIARFNSSRALTWSTFYGGNGDDYANNVLVYGSTTYLVGATSTATGQTLGNQCSPTTTGDFPTCNPGGSATFVNSNAGSGDIFIAAFDNSNALLWSTFYGGTGNEIQRCATMDGSGNLFIGGFTKGSGFNSVAYDHGNNYYYQPSNASTLANPFLIEVNPSHTVTWATHYGGNSALTSTLADEQTYGICTYQSSRLYATGVAASMNFPYRCDPLTAYCYQESSSSNLQDVFVCEFDLTGGVGIDTYFDPHFNFNLYPNPASNMLTVEFGTAISNDGKFNIYNGVGQLVYSLSLSDQHGNTKFDIDVSNFASGFYVARLETANGVSTKKFIKE